MEQEEFDQLIKRIEESDPDLKEIYISYYSNIYSYISLDQLKQLSESLKLNKTVTSIILNYNERSIVGFIAFSKVVDQNQTI